MGEMLVNLMYRVGFVIMLALIFSRVPVFKTIFGKSKQSLKDKLFMGLFFGLLSIVGTYTGISVNGAISNTRVIGVAVGGLLGGPIVGAIAGLIGGGHRFLIDIGGFTAISCGLSTLFEGLIAGFFHSKFMKSQDRIFFSIAIGIVIESFQMLFIILVARPYEMAINLVKVVGIPMIINNSIGIGLFIMIIQNIRKITSAEATYQAKTSLLIADKTLQYLRDGLNNTSAKKVAEIIFKSTSFDAIAITDTEKILSHIGVGQDHHLIGEKCKTNVTLRAIEEGSVKIARNKEDIGCSYRKCKLFSAIIVPLKDGIEIMGTLKLYKTKGQILDQEIELAKGLGNIFSSQLELRRFEEQSITTMKTEMRALQAQINPHFLFNAINTVVALIRTAPESAREVLLHLSDYFRMNMQNNEELIDVNKEIEHIRAYLKIEKARFGDKLNVKWNIEESIKFLLPPLTLQPLVENAVKHGITKNVNGGNILINVKQEKNFLFIQVKDDGVGMNDKRLKEVKEFENNTGIGLTNVFRRLRTFYGEKTKILIESEEGKGTNIKILIPNKKGELYD
jgi:two-component system sensor histidine kinase LytS